MSNWTAPVSMAFKSLPFLRAVQTPNPALQGARLKSKQSLTGSAEIGISNCYRT